MYVYVVTVTSFLANDNDRSYKREIIGMNPQVFRTQEAAEELVKKLEKTYTFGYGGEKVYEIPADDDAISGCIYESKIRIEDSQLVVETEITKAELRD